MEEMDDSENNLITRKNNKKYNKHYNILHLILLIVKNGTNSKPESDKTKRDIGDLGIWTLSSYKQGNGVEQLREDNINTFWQSDGSQPHYVNIQFLKKFRVSVKITIFNKHIRNFGYI
jgi:hypothetical protein